MKKTLRFLGLIAVAAVMVLGFTACQDPEPPPAPVITITIQPVPEVNVTAGSITGTLSVSANVTQGASLSYQWFSSPTNSNTSGTIIPRAINSSFTIPANLTVGNHYFFVEVRASGAEPVRSRVARVNVSLAALPSLAGTVSISGTAETGRTLTADTTGLGGSGTISFQWLQDGNTIAGATGSTYVVRAADVGAAITVRVTRAGNSGYVTSDPTASVPDLIEIGRMVRIQPGSFQMGQTEIATPVHQVTLTQGFYMGIHEVTQAQWRLVMAGNTNGISAEPSHFSAGGGGSNIVTGLDTSNFPVEGVSWYCVLVFANRLSLIRGLIPAYKIQAEVDGQWTTNPDLWGTWWFSAYTVARWDNVRVRANSTGYRLPTEAQWEYAARAGTTTTWSFGNTANNDFMWTSANSGSRTHEVGTRNPNPWGLFDMHGNVWEWVWDWHGTYPSTAQTDPMGASSGSGRVYRGGGWRNTAEFARSANRVTGNPFDRAYAIGFRLVRPVVE